MIDLLEKGQQPTGEFRTFARPSEGDSFFIGNSPFATSLIVYTLSDIQNSNIRSIISKAITHLESIDSRERRLFKFWYPGSVVGTGYPVLPYDMDDTSVVNTALHLHGSASLNTTLFEHNKNEKGSYYTWLQPSIRTLIHYPWLVGSFAIYLKMLPLFLTNSRGQTMAIFKDSEAIVNMNVLTYRAIKGDHVTFSFPTDPNDVHEELLGSLHYDNVVIYYLSLAKLFKHTGTNDGGALAAAIRSVLVSEVAEKKHTNAWALLLSLVYVDELSPNDKSVVEELVEAQESWVNVGIDICVGNKTYPIYHTYWSSDLTHSLALAVLQHI